MDRRTAVGRERRAASVRWCDMEGTLFREPIGVRGEARFLEGVGLVEISISSCSHLSYFPKREQPQDTSEPRTAVNVTALCDNGLHARRKRLVGRATRVRLRGIPLRETERGIPSTWRASRGRPCSPWPSWPPEHPRVARPASRASPRRPWSWRSAPGPSSP